MVERRIVIFEPDVEIAELLQQALADSDIRVAIAGTGDETLRVLPGSNGAVLDIDGSGLSLLKQIRQNPTLNRVPILAMTTSKSPDSAPRQSCRELGVATLDMPFDLKELEAGVAQLLKK